MTTLLSELGICRYPVCMLDVSDLDNSCSKHRMWADQKTEWSGQKLGWWDWSGKCSFTENSWDGVVEQELSVMRTLVTHSLIYKHGNAIVMFMCDSVCMCVYMLVSR